MRSTQMLCGRDTRGAVSDDLCTWLHSMGTKCHNGNDGRLCHSGNDGRFDLTASIGEEWFWLPTLVLGWMLYILPP
jgi:hypothetical protein